MLNRRPLAFGIPCPKCEARLRGEYRFCTNIDCKTWRTFGGEHLHIQCSMCKYVRTTVCADYEESKTIPTVDEINQWLDKLVDEYNEESELDPDWEPSSLDSDE